jgi:hypothetical protein
MLIVISTPLIGWRGRDLRNNARKVSQAAASVAASESCEV